MNSNVYIAGWVYLSPRLNFFKKILYLNPSIHISGIISHDAPWDNLDGIPVISLSEFKDNKNKNNLIVRHSLSDDGKLVADLLKKENFELLELNLFLKKIFLSNNLIAPPGLGSSSEIVRFCKVPGRPKLQDYLDIHSYDLANKLTYIVKSFEWDRFYDFDKGNAIEQSMLEVLSDVYTSGISINFLVTGSVKYYLDLLVALKNRFPEHNIRVELAANVKSGLPAHREFYELFFGEKLFTNYSNGIDSKTLVLAESFEDFPKNYYLQNTPNFLCRLPDSIIGLDRIKSTLKGLGYRYILRQPDTFPGNAFILGIR